MTRCVFDEAWIGQCKADAVEGSSPPRCERHSDKVCWCGAPAVRNCEVASSFVCGAPTCKDHGCHGVSAGFTGSTGAVHDIEGLKQWADWMETQGREIPESYREPVERVRAGGGTFP